MSQLYTNNASSLLVEDLLVAAATINLAPGEGDQFPLPDPGDAESFSMLTLEDVGGNYEIVKMTERSGDILTVIRGEEGTSPAGFATGSRCEARLTAGSLDNFKQVSDQYALRGDLVDSDGIRLWHQQDPSTYQFFTLRYYTNDALGIPMFEIAGPPGISNLHIFHALIGPDGSPRNTALTYDNTSTAPFPSTGEVHLQVPGVIRWDTINSPSVRPGMFASFDKDNVTNTFKMQWASDKTNPISYEYQCRDEFEIAHTIKFNSDGSVSCRNYLEIQNSSDGTYPSADPVQIKHIVSPTNPGDTDILRFRRSSGGTGPRQLRYQFNCLKQTNDDPVEFETRTIIFDEQGRVNVEVEPQADSHLTTKLYVDSAVTGATGGAGLNSLAASLQNRAVLYFNAVGVGNGASGVLDTGLFSDYYQIQVIGETKGSPNILYSVSLDGDTITEFGASSLWSIVDKPGGGDNGGIGIQFDSDTGFSVVGYGDDFAAFRITKIIGVFPRNAGGV